MEILVGARLMMLGFYVSFVRGKVWMWDVRRTYMSISDDLLDDSPDMMVHKQRGSVSLDQSMRWVGVQCIQVQLMLCFSTHFKCVAQGLYEGTETRLSRVQCTV